MISADLSQTGAASAPETGPATATGGAMPAVAPLAWVLRLADFADPQLAALLEVHVRTNLAVTPRGSAHVLDLGRLQRPEIELWALWSGAELVGTGALCRLDAAHGEIKSMHVRQARRRSGAGSAILRHLIDRARALGLSRVSLETGSFAYFQPAVALYRAHGFVECPPFAEYRPDPNSLFMTLPLAPGA